MSLVQYSDHSSDSEAGESAPGHNEVTIKEATFKKINTNVESIRTKFRTKAMQELISKKRRHTSSDSSSDDSDADGSRNQRLKSRFVKDPKGSSLSALLPKPKKTSLFGASLVLETMLRMPESAKISDIPEPTQLLPDCPIIEDGPSPSDDQINRILVEGFGSGADRGNISIIDVDIRKQLNSEPSTRLKDLTLEKDTHHSSHGQDKGGPSSSEKRKNQITYLAQRARKHETEIKNEVALGKTNKMQSRSKYGF